jgi:HAD superfamily phosphoserine phosphatase-like hydrolase
MGIKLVGFDWDGTLVRMPVRHSWGIIDKTLGCTTEMDILKEKYLRKEIDYVEWCRRCIDVYKRLRLTERMLHEIADRDIALHNGAIETINALKSKGVKVGIISGGIYNFYEYISNKFGLSVDYVSFATRLEFDKNGMLAGGEYGAQDYEGKLGVLETYLKKAKATLSEALYVGDAHNDIPIFRAVAGIAFSSDSEELKKSAKYVIKGDDLREILKYVV